MQEITKINHIGIRVSKLDIARAFYEKLGFEFIIGPIGPEPVAIMEHPSGVNINFILNASPESDTNMLMDLSIKHTGYTHMALEITDIESVQRQLAEKNIAITEGPIVLPEGAMFIFVRDPDGNVIELHQPAKDITA